MDESPGEESSADGVTGPGELGTGFSEWRCTQCGHGHPKNNPPCDRCGNMEFELAEVSADEFDAELVGASYLDVLRENALLAVVAAVLVVLALLVVLTGTGAFVLSDPFGLGYRYGAVDAVQPDDDGTLTAGEFRALVAADHDVRSMSWSGRRLDLTYETAAGSRPALREEVGDLAVRYAEYVASGGDAERVRITVTSGDGVVARVTVERSLASRFARGEISRETYVERVFEGSGG